MKKIILLACLLVFGSGVYANATPFKGVANGGWYGMGHATTLYYPFTEDSRTGSMACQVREFHTPAPDISFQLINDGMSWSGAAEGVHTLNASNGYRMVLIFNKIFVTFDYGTVIFVSNSKHGEQFDIECDYKNNTK